MKIKSSDFWKLWDELQQLRADARSHGGEVAIWKRQAQEWRAKYEQAAAGSPEYAAEMEKAIERGRQIGVRQARTALIDGVGSIDTASADNFTKQRT